MIVQILCNMHTDYITGYNRYLLIELCTKISEAIYHYIVNKYIYYVKPENTGSSHNSSPVPLWSLVDSFANWE